MKKCTFFTDESSDDDEYETPDRSERNSTNAIENDADSSGGDQMDVEESNMNWRDNLAQKARSAHLERQSNTQNLMKIVYGALNAVRNYHAHVNALFLLIFFVFF